MKCAFPIIENSLKNGEITVENIAKLVNADVELVREKLCGKKDFDINEAMLINNVLFPSIPFKMLFTKKEGEQK